MSQLVKTKSLRLYNTQTPKLCGISVNINALGKGSYGSVYMAQNTIDGKVISVALKLIDISATDDNLIEPIIMKTLYHPNILSAYNLYDSKQCGANRIGYTMPLGVSDLSPITNEHKIRSSEAYLRPKFADMARGLEFMHRCGFLHGDIKPANIILFADQSVKISDFGLSFNLDTQPIVSKLMYSGWFRPPELRLNKPYIPSTNSDGKTSGVTPYLPSFATDIWALGMTYCYLLIGNSIFDWHKDIKLADGTTKKYDLRQMLGEENQQSAIQQQVVDALYHTFINTEYLNKIVKLCYNKVLGPTMNNGDKAIQFEKLLTSMLNADPSHRPSAFEVYSHPYFSTPVSETVLYQGQIMQQVISYSSFAFDVKLGVYSNIKFPEITNTQIWPESFNQSVVNNIKRLKAGVEAVHKRMVINNRLVSEYLIAVDILYQSLILFEFDNPGLLTDAILLIVDDLVGKPGWTNNSAANNIKRNIIFKLGGRVYRRHLHYYARNTTDLSKAYSLTLNPKSYIDVKTSQDVVTFYAIDSVVIPKIIDPTVNKYNITLRLLVDTIIPTIVEVKQNPIFPPATSSTSVPQVLMPTFTSQASGPTFTSQASGPTFASQASGPTFASQASGPTFASQASGPTFASQASGPTFTSQASLPTQSISTNGNQSVIPQYVPSIPRSIKLPPLTGNRSTTVTLQYLKNNQPLGK